MWFEQVLFFVAAIGALGGALGVVILRNPFYSVISLVGHLISLGVLFLLLRAEFLALALLIEICFAVFGSGLSALDSRGAHVGPGFGSPGEIGRLLLERFLVVFEAASFLCPWLQLPA